MPLCDSNHFLTDHAPMGYKSLAILLQSLGLRKHGVLLVDLVFRGTPFWVCYKGKSTGHPPLWGVTKNTHTYPFSRPRPLRGNRILWGQRSRSRRACSPCLRGISPEASACNLKPWVPIASHQEKWNRSTFAKFVLVWTSFSF